MSINVAWRCAPLHMREVFHSSRSGRAIFVASFSSAVVPGKLKVVTPPPKTKFNSVEEHEAFIRENAILPKGFSAATGKLEFFPEELGAENTKAMKMNLSIIKPDRPIEYGNYAAMFTSNAFPGAPIKVGREIVNSKKAIGALIINNKVSNVHPGGGGVKAASEVCSELQKVLKLSENCGAVPSSTGVIGWRIPVKEMKAALPEIAGRLKSGSIFDVARAIMTTDNYPKARTVSIVDEHSKKEIGRITGIAKGAGMIEPHMATMLVYVLTDMKVGGLDTKLREAVNRPASFNRISIDSDQSTSDTILLLSSAMSDKPAQLTDDAWGTAFQIGLEKVCSALAHDVVRNGEGVGHVIKVIVKDAPSMSIAHGAGKAIVNSPLLKTAIAGNDPNVGRLIMAIGKYVGEVDPEFAKRVSGTTTIHFGEVLVFSNGEFTLDGNKEAALTEYMKRCQQSLKGYPPHEEVVEITVDLGSGKGFSTTVIGADLTSEYVDVNAGYRS